MTPPIDVLAVPVHYRLGSLLSCPLKLMLDSYIDGTAYIVCTCCPFCCCLGSSLSCPLQLILDSYIEGTAYIVCTHCPGSLLSRFIAVWPLTANVRQLEWWHRRYVNNDNDNNNNNNRIQRRYSRFFLQSPHSAANCLQHVRSSGQDATVCKSRATHRALITCKCHVTCHLVRRDSSAIKFDRVEIAFIWALFYWLNY